jgi:hypothetical protein
MSKLDGSLFFFLLGLCAFQLVSISIKLSRIIEILKNK